MRQCYCETVKNITVSVPDDVYRGARVAAALLDTSVSAMVVAYLDRLSGQLADRDQTRDRAVRATIDTSGRLVIPKAVRDSLGLVPGEVEVTVDGAGLHIGPLADDSLADEDGLLVIPAANAVIGDDFVRRLRDAGQR